MCWKILALTAKEPFFATNNSYRTKYWFLVIPLSHCTQIVPILLVFLSTASSFSTKKIYYIKEANIIASEQLNVTIFTH